MSDSRLPEAFDEVCDLITALREGCITPEQEARLDELVRHDEESCRIYVQYMHLYANLRWRKMQESPTPSRAPAAKSPVLGFLGECWNQGASFLWKSNVFSVLVAIGLPMAAILLVTLTMLDDAPPSPVAVVARSRDCAGRLDEQPATFYLGRNLFAKQRLVIDKGLIEIQFADGAGAVLEGPAAFEILGGNGGSLTRGRLAAVVPLEARGFTVETPSARVVDLGTEFGVLVGDDGRVEAHVFDGQVEVVMPGELAGLPGAAALLTEGEAVHIAANDDRDKSPKIVRMRAATDQFTRTISLPEPTILFAHRGSANPTMQGWTAYYRQYGEGFPKDGAKLGQIGRVVGPIEEEGTAAWQLRPCHGNKQVFYDLRESAGLARQLRAEAREKGWVLRARIRIDAPSASWDGNQAFRCVVMYRDEGHAWGFYPRLDAEGNQYVGGVKPGTGPFADSRNQYVDYELRYDPAVGNAELFVNGRHVATRRGPKDPDSDNGGDEPYPTIRFGGSRHAPAKVRFAKVEWGILRDNDKTEPRP